MAGVTLTETAPCVAEGVEPVRGLLRLLYTSHLLQAWKQFEGAYRDDITVIVVYVRELMCHLGSERASAETVGRETAQG